jgi:DNA polymerase I-like protein with 3'-5' exonuclease and polymerase domains
VAIPKVVAHNAAYDCKWMIYYGIKLYPTFDTMLAQHLLDENRLKGLKPMAQDYLGVEPWGIDTKNLLETPLQDILPYNMLDSWYMRLLKKILVKKLLEDERQAKIMMRLYMPAMRVLIDSEMRGIYIDVKRLEERMPIAQKTLDEIEVKILEAAGLSSTPNDPWLISPGHPDWPTEARGKPREVNFNASLFARWMLFEHLGLPILERGKDKDDGRPGDPSMAEGVLMALRDEHPAVEHMLDRVKWQKYISSFFVPYQELYDADHRIHTNFKLAGTVTGRLSSGKTDDDKITGVRGKVRGVNLQQVPRDPFIRGLFAAPPGWFFVQADYSQVELRLAAFLADEKVMKRAYQLGLDIHTITAARITGLPEKGLPKEIRKKVGKPVNFGFLYGMQWAKFISTAFENYGSHFTEDEARAARQTYFDLYPGLLPWHAKQKALVRRYGRVQSPLGRIRHLPDIYSPEHKVQAEAERQAINSPVQGFASDLAVLSMIEIDKIIKREKMPAHILGLVHDAINLEVRDDAAPEVLPMVKQTMEDMGVVERKFGVYVDVPIVADLSVGQHWGDLVELDANSVFNFDPVAFRANL